MRHAAARAARTRPPDGNTVERSAADQTGPRSGARVAAGSSMPEYGGSKLRVLEGVDLSQPEAGVVGLGALVVANLLVLREVRLSRLAGSPRVLDSSVHQLCRAQCIGDPIRRGGMGVVTSVAHQCPTGSEWPAEEASQLPRTGAV